MYIFGDAFHLVVPSFRVHVELARRNVIDTSMAVSVACEVPSVISVLYRLFVLFHTPLFLVNYVRTVG